MTTIPLSFFKSAQSKFPKTDLGRNEKTIRPIVAYKLIANIFEHPKAVTLVI